MSNNQLYSNLIASMNNPEAARAWKASILYYDAMMKNYNIGLKYYDDRNKMADFINAKFEDDIKFNDVLKLLIFIYFMLYMIMLWSVVLTHLH